jgi:thioester reductase-like protein
VSGRLTVLVTGASGLIGAEVAARLADAGHDVIGLVHANGSIVRNNGRAVRSAAYPRPRSARPGVQLLAGDITEPGLGLPARVRAELAARLDRIVHCAAVTDFGRPAELYQSVNVAGTANVLELAGAGGTALVHVGTAYVCGERDGVVTEGELDVGQRLANHYEESKLQAELLVRKAGADGLPFAVVRPSIVVGAERTGVVREYKHIYVVLKLMTEGKVRTLPGHYDAVVDLVPVDYAADVVKEVTTRFPEAEGRTFHAAGGELRLRDFSDVLAEFPSFHVAHFVPPSSFDADRLPVSEQFYYRRIVSLYDSYMRRRAHFDSAATDAFVARRRPARGRPILRRLLDHALSSGYLGTALPTVSDVLAAIEERTER